MYAIPSIQFKGISFRITKGQFTITILPRQGESRHDQTWETRLWSCSRSDRLTLEIQITATHISSEDTTGDPVYYRGMNICCLVVKNELQLQTANKDDLTDDS